MKRKEKVTPNWGIGELDNWTIFTTKTRKGLAAPPPLPPGSAGNER